MVKKVFEALQVHHLKILYFPSATHNPLAVMFLVNCKKNHRHCSWSTGQGASEALKQTKKKSYGNHEIVWQKKKEISL